jgi:hypothetical protein
LVIAGSLIDIASTCSIIKIAVKDKQKGTNSIIKLRVPLLLSALAIVFQSCVFRQGERSVACGKEHNLEIVSLAVYPDPLPESRRIDEWRVRIRSNAPKECQTTVGIVEKGKPDPVAQEKPSVLSPGISDISLNAAERYRFSGKEQCFDVVTLSDGSKRPVDSARELCARLVDGRWWSMR